MSLSTHRLIVVTPVYEDVEASSLLFQEIAAQLHDDVFVVVVDDGSVKQPLDIGIVLQLWFFRAHYLLK